MIVEHEILKAKRQSKMMDCWYACIQMLRSSTMGAKTKPQGSTMVVERTKNDGIAFSSSSGAAVLAENHLVDVSNKIKLKKMMTLATTLETYGPVILSGKFAFFNRYGHCIVVSGCDTDRGIVTVYDPGWGQGKQTKSWDYITRHLHKMQGDDDAPGPGSVVANETEVASATDFAATRQRR